MWPLRIDMSKDECRGALRRLELEAYSSVVSTFRAQGSLNDYKQNVLDQLRKVFNISEDRHKAEVRRVANSEKLTTISELLTGKANDLEWIREGHRSYPLIARAPPYSALHILAEHASKAAAAENSTLPEAFDTRRTHRLDELLVPGKPTVLEDPNLPPPSPSVFGISRKDLKKSFDSVATLHQSAKRKHYQHLKPPPPPNLRIQHLYQTLNTKRPRKSLTKKSAKVKKSSPSSGRIHLPAPPSSSSSDDKSFDSAELHRHLTSQLMPPPMSPMKSPTSQYQPILPATSKQRKSQMEPAAHYIPNNPSRLKSELLGMSTSPSKKQRVSKNAQQARNYQPKYANGAGMRGMDHIPDPQIIFNTASSSSSSVSTSIKIENDILHHSLDQHHQHHHNQHHDLDMSSQASPLQLLSTAASCTPKLKVNSSPQILQTHLQQPQAQQHVSQQPTPPPQPVKANVQNRQIKIIPTNTKPVIIKQSDIVSKAAPTQPQPPQQQQQNKFKIQKFQLMVNKQEVSNASTANISPTTTIISSKPGQFVLSSKGITNSYQVAKSPYSIVTTSKASVTSVPKVVTIQSTSSSTKDASESSNDNQIEFSPATAATTTTSYPKVIIQKSPATSTTARAIKLNIGTMNTKILHAPLTSFKIQRNVNTKGFTVINPSQIVQIQQQPQSIQQQIVQQSASTPASSVATTSQIIVTQAHNRSMPSPKPAVSQVVVPTTAAATTTTTTPSSKETTSTKVDWEQELDDVNRVKGGKSQSKSNGSGIAPKKAKKEVEVEKVVEIENVIVETVDALEEDEADSIVVYENPDILASTQKEQLHNNEIVEDFVFFKPDEDVIIAKAPETTTKSDDQIKMNGDAIVSELNGETDENVRSSNGAEAYENLVKSLNADDWKELEEESIVDENFSIMESNIIDFTSQPGLF